MSMLQGEGMKHYVEKVQQPEFAAAEKGYTFVAHQQEVGDGYFRFNRLNRRRTILTDLFVKTK